LKVRPILFLFEGDEGGKDGEKMKILFVPDKFKGSMTAREAAEAMMVGVRGVFPEADLEFVAVADGGEGIVEACRSALGGVIQRTVVRDALGRSVEGEWLLVSIGGERVAVVETSQACGLYRIQETERDLMRSSTQGVGDLFRSIASVGVSKIVAGIGGSATNDLGIGMAEALGFQFWDEKGERVEGIPRNFLKIDRITAPDSLSLPPITVASDVVNPLLGPRGATRVYGFQKGLKLGEVEPMERGHAHVVEVVRRDFGIDFSEREGAGAAGGLGYGLMSFCGAELQSGFDWMARAIGLERKIQEADVIVTGEGSLDSQTLEGKTVCGILRLARIYGKPVYAIAGRIGDEELLRDFFTGMTSIMEPGMTEEESKRNATELTRKAAERMAKGWSDRIKRIPHGVTPTGVRGRTEDNGGKYCF
jgi:glycerate kinase